MADTGIRIVGFETRYVPDPVDPRKLKEVDYVEFSQVGNAKYQVTPMRIVDAQRDISEGGMLWKVIGPAYEAWKKGEELPEGGTPLAAWNGCTPALAKVLKGFDIRTVEDIAALTDGMLQKIGVPGLRNVRDAARSWEAAKGIRDIDAALSEKDAQIQAMQDQMAVMMEMLQGQKGDNTEEPVKRRPGRPRKEEAEEAAA